MGATRWIFRIDYATPDRLPFGPLSNQSWKLGAGLGFNDEIMKIYNPHAPYWPFKSSVLARRGTTEIIPIVCQWILSLMTFIFAFVALYGDTPLLECSNSAHREPPRILVAKDDTTLHQEDTDTPL